MPMKLTTGVSQKSGLPDYGSIGASCSVELEISSDALEDLEGFHRQVQSAFTACRQAVQDELARQQQRPAAPVANGQSNGHGSSNGHGRPSGRKATASQVRAIHAILNRQALHPEHNQKILRLESG